MTQNKKQELLSKFVEKADMLGAGAVLLGFFLKYSSNQFGQIVLIIGFGSLATASVYKSYMVYIELDGMERFVLKGAVMTAAIGMIASLFRIMRWPNNLSMYYTFFGAVAVILVVSLFKSKNPINFVPFNELLKIAGVFLVYFLL